MNISGSQHRQMPYEMTETYKELFRCVKKSFSKEKLLRSFPAQGSYYNEHLQISRLTPFDGENFPVNDEEAMRYIEPAVRLMVIGDNEIGKAELTEKSAEEFSCSAGETICYTNLMSHCSIDKTTAPEYLRHVIEELKPVSSIGDRWYEHILWYNPFVFDVSGNACTNKKLQEIQFPLCQKLLFQSVDIFVPTHILFMAGTEKFAKNFPEDKSFIKQIIKAF